MTVQTKAPKARKPAKKPVRKAKTPIRRATGGPKVSQMPDDLDTAVEQVRKSKARKPTAKKAAQKPGPIPVVLDPNTIEEMVRDRLQDKQRERAVEAARNYVQVGTDVSGRFNYFNLSGQTAPTPAPKPSAEDKLIEKTLGKLPAQWRDSLGASLTGSAEARAAMRAIMERVDEFDSPERAMLAAAGMIPATRKAVNEALDNMWKTNGVRTLPTAPEEVVIGAGLHAAIYCAVRVASGFAPPVVLEASDTVGGTFAMTSEPSFYLNSRNRPGGLGNPGEGLGLNVLPGAVVQPCDIGGAEFQTNADLAWSIRLTLAMRARVFPGARVSAIKEGDGTFRRRYEIETIDGRVIRTDRVIVATGLGRPTPVFEDAINASERVMTFADLMKRANQPFPLRGMKRVAVIGGGDSGKTALEMLLGQGPSTGMSTAALDFPEKIDWYGAPYNNARDFKNNIRSRYARLGCFLPRGSGRITPQGQAARVAVGYDCATVDNRRYDHVIVCTGFQKNSLVPPGWALTNYDPQARRLARRYLSGDGGSSAPGEQDVFLIGPAAGLAVAPGEANTVPALVNVPENATALFRYADRTAALAALLD